MIRNLNQETFRKFGTILPEKGENISRVNHHSVLLSAGTVSFYQACADIWLRNESGMAVLSVMENKQTYDFYLDKPVWIRSGVRFSLTAFKGNATVQFAGIALPSLEKTGLAEDRFSIRRIMELSAVDMFFYQEKEQGFVFSGDVHPMAELTYVDKGPLHSVVDGRDFLLEQGDIMLYGPNQWHMQYADTGIAPGFVTICFDLTNFDWPAMVNRVFHTSAKTSELLHRMIREQERMEPGAEDMILSLLTQLLIALKRESESTDEKVYTVNGINSENEMIRRAQQYVSGHIREKLTVPVLAQKTKISPSYLTALFQKHLQISPAEYIRRVKLQESKQMIREGSMNFTEIAETLQYSTVHHFSRQFKEKFGITPTQYAKSVR